MQEEIFKLQQQINDLTEKIDRDNFSKLQVNAKDVYFEKRVRLFNKSANLAVCQTGELSVVGGKLYICSAANTWTVVGTQT